jgi:hypothetical protein
LPKIARMPTLELWNRVVDSGTPVEPSAAGNALWAERSRI